MKLMLDAHLSGSKVGEPLRLLGHDVVTAERLERVGDEDLLAMASAQGRVLVTHNVKDFARILRHQVPERSHAGLILIPFTVRLNDFGALIAGIDATTSRHAPGEWVDKVMWMTASTP